MHLRSPQVPGHCALVLRRVGYDLCTHFTLVTAHTLLSIFAFRFSFRFNLLVLSHNHILCVFIFSRLVPMHAPNNHQ